MPDRIVRQSILTSEAVNQLSWPANVFFYRLLNVVDDFGRYDGREAILRPALYPLQLSRVAEPDIRKWIAECEEAGVVRVYTVDGRPYLQLAEVKWDPRAKKSRWPEPPSSANTCAHVRADDDTRQQTRADAPVVVGVVDDVGGVDSAAAAFLSSESKTRAGAREQQAQPPATTTPPKPPATPEAPEAPAGGLLDLLQERCIDQGTIDWAMQGFPLATIRIAVGRMDAVAKLDGKVNNPSGLLRELLTKGVSGPVVRPKPASRTTVATGPTRAQRDAQQREQLAAQEQAHEQSVMAWLGSLSPEDLEHHRRNALASFPEIARKPLEKKTPAESVLLRDRMYDLAHAQPA